MDRRQRGVAHVNIFWALVPMVLFIGAGFFAYTKQIELDEAKADRLQAINSADQAANEKLGLQRQLESITAVVGCVGEFKHEGALADLPVEKRFTTGAAVKDALENFKQRHAIPTSIADVPSVLNDITGEINRINDRVKSLDGELTGAQATIAAQNASLAQVRSEKDAEKDRIEGEKVAAERNMTNAVRSKEEELAQARSKAQDARDERRKDLEAHSLAMADMQKKYNGMAQTNVTLAEKNSLINSPELPDGAILSSNDRILEAVIDLGARDAIKKGMTFQVLDKETHIRFTLNKAAGEFVKALATVVEVSGTSARVKIHGVADKYNPVVKGDLIRNDLYSKNFKRDICLVGRFVEPYTKGELKRMLEAYGHRVHDEWDASCDLLVLGRQPVGEDVTKIEDTEAYQKASEHRVEIAPLWKIKDFLVR
ncbi:MAG: hypothetical protein R3F30_08315 [Planctomycetota bacterium]